MQIEVQIYLILERDETLQNLNYTVDLRLLQARFAIVSVQVLAFCIQEVVTSEDSIRV